MWHLFSFIYDSYFCQFSWKGCVFLFVFYQNSVYLLSIQFQTNKKRKTIKYYFKYLFKYVLRFILLFINNSLIQIKINKKNKNLKWYIYFKTLFQLIINQYTINLLLFFGFIISNYSSFFSFFSRENRSYLNLLSYSYFL